MLLAATWPKACTFVHVHEQTSFFMSVVQCISLCSRSTLLLLVFFIAREVRGVSGVGGSEMYWSGFCVLRQKIVRSVGVAAVYRIEMVQDNAGLTAPYPFLGASKRRGFVPHFHKARLRLGDSGDGEAFLPT